MSYWNENIIENISSKSNLDTLQFKINTDFGRFYFNFERDRQCSIISGKVIFFLSLDNSEF
ncbi:MAG: hypothetical protein GF317_09405 [Candidatus Lokiarchaeota archaeon]|nr:hypothetical protein [Candidatus Lokiarchaeota archaeon]MBD3199928.1 hypothetical protein [Candidatus Lokiarchaeota archaeon]